MYCDESVRDGKYVSNFYGGVLVGASDIDVVRQRLNTTKVSLGLGAEAKWVKVSHQYVDRYMALMDAFFDEVETDKLKVRVMFRPNALVAVNLTAEQIQGVYLRLYFPFIKHAFGFKHLPKQEDTVRLRTYFDKLPDTKENIDKFKGFILGLNRQTEFGRARIAIAREDIAEVDSHDHAILQCLDVVLGAMAFRLNDKHKVTRPETGRRAKGTVAKERLYKHILQRIRKIRPGFNVGVNTGGSGIERWTQPYRHWRFEPKNFTFDQASTKSATTKKTHLPY